MSLKINSVAPDFKAKTSEGDISFHEWLGDSWGVLFSHPKDFTPVCTTELGALAKMKPEFEKRKVKVIDTHIHADHISGLNELSKRTNCTKIMGEHSLSEVIDIRVKDNEKIKIDNIELISMYTPGHTECSYSF